MHPNGCETLGAARLAWRDAEMAGKTAVGLSDPRCLHKDGHADAAAGTPCAAPLRQLLICVSFYFRVGAR